MKKRHLVLPLLCAIAPLPVSAAEGTTAKGWKKQTVTTDFLTEGIAAGDLDGDGIADLVAGAFWFKGPDFKERVRFKDGDAQGPKTYQEDSFLSWVEDFNGDGKNDILMASHPGKNMTLYLNPGKGVEGKWPAHVVMTEAATEGPVWTDLDGDGKKELVCMQGGKFGYAKPDWKEITKPWPFTPVSEVRANTPYVHGLGVGDLNGDKKPDILAKDGWFQQPAKTGEAWTWHAQDFGKAGGAQMLVFDVDGDGTNDVVTALNGHGYGLAWFAAKIEKGEVSFTRHDILPEDGTKTDAAGLQFSQPHALEMADFDGDGRMDFVTGKRWYAHNGGDPDAEGAALTVVFYNKKKGGDVVWQSQVVDTDAGVGCQVQAMDVNRDRKPDILVGNKKGVYVISKP